ncbi:MAG: hypothetical protein U5R14_12930 [Gemmatimonadota bacterium]|nr:hypothetical protein [Gemmatimonadota bacterium]
MQSVQTGYKSRRKLNRLSAGLLTAAFAVGATGCDSLLDVENPNNVVQSDLENAEAVSALVNGALQLTSEAVGDAAVSTTALSDELTHTGSQNWAAELDRGIITTPSGRSDALTDVFAEATWTAEEALRLAVEFGADDEQVMRANMYSGIMHMTIADNMEDFAFSDRIEVGPPVGEDNMQSVYDTAIDRLESALALASGSDATTIRALLARAHWGRAMWPKMQGDPTADPLVNDATANGYAQDVIDAIGVDEDWAYRFRFQSSTSESPQGSWVNSRQEFVPADEYVVISGSGKSVAQDEDDADGDGDTDEAAISLLDPIDDMPDQALQARITEFVDAFLYPEVDVVTARELHLILAEAAIADGEDDIAETHLNHVRAMKNPDHPHDEYDVDNPLHPEPLEVLQHERRVNLYNMVTRRLWDMYRFGVTAPRWSSTSDAVTNPGQVFVIGQGERVSNCFILGTC